MSKYPLSAPIVEILFAQLHPGLPVTFDASATIDLFGIISYLRKKTRLSFMISKKGPLLSRHIFISMFAFIASRPPVADFSVYFRPFVRRFPVLEE